jgi:MraZ protein
MLVFTGTHTHKVDKKGRVSVPAPFRAALTKAGTAEIAVFPSYISKAVEGYGPDLIETLANSTFAAYNPFGASPENAATQIFELMRQLEWDGEGRVGIPEEMMAHAGITEQAVFVGKGRFFQIWSPEGLAGQRSADAATIAQNPPRLFQRRPEGS